MQLTPDVSDLDSILHDAELDLETLITSEEGVVVHGELRMRSGGFFNRLRPKRFVLKITGGTNIDLMDEAGIGSMPVRSVAFNSTVRSLQFESHLPIVLSVSTSTPDCVLEIED